jgi:hypothetical protein
MLEGSARISIYKALIKLVQLQLRSILIFEDVMLQHDAERRANSVKKSDF